MPDNQNRPASKTLVKALYMIVLCALTAYLAFTELEKPVGAIVAVVVGLSGVGFLIAGLRQEYKKQQAKNQASDQTPNT
jgi:heme O synthase-like polyprenyltransferase